MTQNTLSEEINRIVDEWKRVYEVPEDSKQLDILAATLRLIATKTVEAVRVEEMTKDNHNISKMEYYTMGLEHTQGKIQGHNQAITEQSKLASRWLGKEN